MTLPISIRDPYDIDQVIYLMRSYTKPGKVKVRIHVFQTHAEWCELCGHTTKAREFSVEVTNR